MPLGPTSFDIAALKMPPSDAIVRLYLRLFADTVSIIDFSDAVVRLRFHYLHTTPDYVTFTPPNTYDMSRGRLFRRWSYAPLALRHATVFADIIFYAATIKDACHHLMLR